MNIEQIAALYIAEKRRTKEGEHVRRVRVGAARRHVLPRWGSMRVEGRGARRHTGLDRRLRSAWGRREGVEDPAPGDTLGHSKARGQVVGPHGGGREAAEEEAARAEDARRRPDRCVPARAVGVPARGRRAFLCFARSSPRRGARPQVGGRRLADGRGARRADVRLRPRGVARVRAEDGEVAPHARALPPFALRRLRVLRGGRAERVVAEGDLTKLGRAIKAWCSRRGVPWVPLQNLRHTWATLAVEAGVGIETVSMLLGHTDIGTAYEHYVRPRRSIAREAQRAVQELVMRCSK